MGGGVTLEGKGPVQLIQMEGFLVHKLFVKLHSKTAWQHSPQQEGGGTKEKMAPFSWL